DDADRRRRGTDDDGVDQGREEQVLGSPREDELVVLPGHVLGPEVAEDVARRVAQRGRRLQRLGQDPDQRDRRPQDDRDRRDGEPVAGAIADIGLHGYLLPPVRSTLNPLTKIAATMRTMTNRITDSAEPMP